jgi:hypothetical protein
LHATEQPLDVMNPLPSSREAWLNEIAQALRDASAAIPFGPLAGTSFGADELFHLGPVTALKFRGMRRSKRIAREITEAALASYVATASEGTGSLTDPRVAFAFTYLASHFALNLITEQQVAELMDYIESHPEALRVDLGTGKPG